MGEVINLNRARKAREKAEAARQAGERRVIFGRTRMDKEAVTKAAEQAERTLDGKKLDE